MTLRLALPLAFLVAAGCASPYSPSSTPAARIAKDRALYESWPYETQIAVLDQDIKPGMTPEMVVMSLGKPTKTEPLPGSKTGEELWVYGVDYSENGGGGGGGSSTTLSIGGGIPIGGSGSIGMGQTIPLGGGQDIGRSEGYREVIFKDGVVEK